ncbi:MAG: hypothetical protein ACRC6H_08155 [Culicoidibacterales bacterium]
MVKKVIGVISVVFCLFAPIFVQATTTPSSEPLSCVEVGWVVENNTKFGIRNQCDQRIYVKIFDGTTQINSEFLDKGQWFPIAQGYKIELFDGEASYQAGTVTRAVELTLDTYCQTLPEDKTVSECENYVAPVEPEATPTPEVEVTPSIEPEVTPAPESEDTPSVESEVDATQIPLWEQPYVVAAGIFVSVLVVGGLSFGLVQRLRKPKGIYLRERKHRKFRK